MKPGQVCQIHYLERKRLKLQKGYFPLKIITIFPLEISQIGLYTKVLAKAERMSFLANLTGHLSSR